MRLISLLALATALLGCASETSDGTTESEDGLALTGAESDVSVVLAQVDATTAEMTVRGTFRTCLHSSPTLLQARLEHPIEPIFRPRGELALSIGSPVLAELCHVMSSAHADLKVRVTSQPDADSPIEPFALRRQRTYVLEINGRPHGALSVDAAGQIALEPSAG
jgi:hypothetical protein